MHLIGKDIIRFHCLYWPAILHAAGLPVPTRLFAQGWITKNGKKLSKTSGNVIDPVQLVKDYGADAVRYFLLREGVYGQDWDFTDDAFVTRFNADLANDLGNLASRVLTMVKNYCGGKVPSRRRRRRGGPLVGLGLREVRGAGLLGGARRDLEPRRADEPGHRRLRPVGGGEGPVAARQSSTRSCGGSSSGCASWRSSSSR